MTDLSGKLATLADQLGALLADVEKVHKANVKELRFSLERIARASTDALERLDKSRRPKRPCPVMDPTEDWSDIVVRGLDPET